MLLFLRAESQHPSMTGKDRIQTLRNERAALTQQQSEATRRATYVGMSAEQAKAFEARRTQLEALTRELEGLTKDQRS